MDIKHVHSNKLRNTILLAGAALTLGVFASTTNTYASDNKTPVANTTTSTTNNNTKKDTDAANPTPTTPALDTTYASAKAAIDATSTESAANQVASQQKEQEEKAINSYYSSQKMLSLLNCRRLITHKVLFTSRIMIKQVRHF